MDELLSVWLLAAEEQGASTHTLLRETCACQVELITPGIFPHWLQVARQAPRGLLLIDRQILSEIGPISQLFHLLGHMAVVFLLSDAKAEEASELLAPFGVQILTFKQLTRVGLNQTLQRIQKEGQIEAHLRRDRSLSELSHHLLTENELQSIFEHAARLTVEALGLRYSTISEWIDAQSCLIPRASHGWAQAEATPGPIPADSQEGYTWAQSRPRLSGPAGIYDPLIVEDLTLDTRFHWPRLLHGAPVRSGISIVIMCKMRGLPFGVLGAFDSEAHTFSPEDAVFIQCVAHILGAAVQKFRLERQLSDNLREAREHRDQLQQMILSIKDYAIFMIDKSGCIMNWNAEAERITGYSSRQAIGKNFSLFFPHGELDQAHSDTVLDQARRRGRFEAEGVCLKRDGSRLIASILIVPVYDGAGNLRGFTSITQDKTSERQSQERLRLAFDAAHMSSWDWDVKTGSITWVNGGQIVKSSRVLDRLDVMNRIHVDDVALVRRTIEESLISGRDLNIEFRMRGSSGRMLWIVCRGRVFYDEHHQPLRLVGIAMDISDKKRAEEELKEAKDLAERANEAKSTFLASMSHEIRTPLNAIMGFAELLDNSNVNAEKQREFVSTITRNGKMLSQLLDDILDLSKVEAGKLTVESIRCSVPEIISDVYRLLNQQAQDKGIYLHFSADQALPQYIDSDPNRLKQILFNIIGNAIKFTLSGGVRVSIEAKNQSHGQDPCLIFSVQDTGPGIPDEQQALLFQPFSQADVSMSRKFGGTGLGLTLSRKLAQLLGGSVELAWSEVDKGSNFIITVQAVAASGCYRFEDAIEAEHHFKPILDLESERLLAQISVLVVEDAPDSRALVTQILSQYGAVVSLAENGLEALHVTLDHDFDVVLMDLHMPLLDGFAATAELRRLGYSKPILAVSAAAMKDEKDKALQVGCNDHLTKPFSIGILVQKILEYAGRLAPSPTSSQVESHSHQRGHLLQR